MILAGVSLNAIVGDNGIIDNALSASFIQEMTAVQEAFDTWKMSKKIDDLEDVSLPTEKIVESKTLEEHKRLMGEVGYYRSWSVTGEKPTTDVKEDEDSFKSAGSSEIVFYPAGVQDLYYLDNDTLGLEKNNKKYLIDAQNSMIYSLNGGTINGIRVHSLAMFRMIQNGISDAPQFAEAEASSGSGAFAGSKWLTDKDGNYIDESGNRVDEEHRVENPYGFEIIASNDSDNIYKLYNNGELYGKGIKGIQLNTSKKETDLIDSEKFLEFSIPKEIGEYKKIIQGNQTMYVIDINDNLWAWGKNEYNKLGLTKEQQNEYTGREVIKVDVNGKKVKKVFDLMRNLFVLTEDNKLFGCGRNTEYELGLGHNNEVSSFQLIDIPEPEKIKDIYRPGEWKYYTLIAYDNNKFYACGESCFVLNGRGDGEVYKFFTPVFNGYSYKYDENNKQYIIDENIKYNEEMDIGLKIKKIVCNQRGVLILDNDGNLFFSSGRWVPLYSLSKYDYGNNVKNIYSHNTGCIIEKNDGKIYGFDIYFNNVGLKGTIGKFEEIELPSDLKDDGIKEIFMSYDTVYFLSNSGKLFAASSLESIVIGEAVWEEGIFAIPNAPKIETMYDLGEKFEKTKEFNTEDCVGTVIFKGKDGKNYMTGNSEIPCRDEILQGNWTSVAKNVKRVALGEDNRIAYVDRNNDVYVAGGNSSYLGMNIEDKKVPNFEKITDEHIAGKAENVQFGTSVIIVLTIDGNVYSSGLYSVGTGLSWPNGRYPGWEEEENHFNFVQLENLDNIKYLQSEYRDSVALGEENLFAWGENIDNQFEVLGTLRVPTEIKIDGVEAKDIKKCVTSFHITVVILNNGGVYINGGSGREDVGESLDTSNKFVNYDKYFNGEKVIDCVVLRGEAVLFLTESGNVYGYGTEKYLGNNSMSTRYNKEITKLNISDVSQIAVGKGFFICITKDGRVFGTGSNNYGILGRWKGVSRGSSNSRYKTAFEWVECPELEI